MTTKLTSRRALLKGLAGLTVLAAGGVVWRAWSNGVFHVGSGPAYEPWHDWRDDPLDGPLALVRAGILAANAHNTQPWRFHVAENQIAVFADHARHLGAFDPFRREMALSLGCAIENMVQTARAQGSLQRVELTPDRLGLGGPAYPDQAVATIHLVSGQRTESELFQAISHRHTHRGPYDSERAVSAELQDQMRTLTEGHRDVRLILFDNGPAKDRLGKIIITATEEIIGDHEMAMDSAKWFRFDWRSIQEHRDGITLDAMALPPLINSAAKIVRAPSADVADQQWLSATRDVHVASAPLLGMIAVRELYDQPTTLEAGRLWQRLHLWATARGLAAHPLNMPPERVDREAELRQAPRMAAILAEFTDDPTWQPTFVFRMGYAGRPAHLSPRRPLDAVVAA